MEPPKSGWPLRKGAEFEPATKWSGNGVLAPHAPKIIVTALEIMDNNEMARNQHTGSPKIAKTNPRLKEASPSDQAISSAAEKLGGARETAIKYSCRAVVPG